jgi:hypothetical protein
MDSNFGLIWLKKKGEVTISAAIRATRTAEGKGS